uniref:Uncharacterized protein LOC114328315 n=1 Tax=Diabrotica virgifera virgifera TaxID=50390 RepID=A0A6P7FBH4_DIAVI
MDSWSEDQVLELIEAYRRWSVLWDFQDPLHYDKSIIYRAWKEVGREQNPEVRGVEDCKRKIKSLLSSYRREKYKMRKSKGSKYVSKWYAYEPLTFLDDRVMPKKPPKEEPEDMMEDVDVDDIGVEVKLSELSPDETSAPSPINIPSKRAKTDDYPTSSMLDNELNIFDTVKEKPNETDTFFTYVATKVNNYSRETQTAVQHAVFEILMKADKGKYESSGSDHQESNS